jgi:hypothetical protein
MCVLCLTGVDAIRLRLGSWIGTLENATHLLNVNITAHAGTVERCAALVQCMVIADSLRRDDDLQNILRRCLFALLPLAHAQQLATQLADVHMFDKSQLCRGRLYIDVAHMMVWRDRNEREMSSGCARYVMIDSSPQFKRDFELLWIKSIPRSALDLSFKLARDLRSVWSQDFEHDQFVDDGRPLEEERLIQQLSELFNFHVTPPTQIGFGAGSLEKRLHAALHSLRLELKSHDALVQYISEVVCWLSDYGTEYGVSKVKEISGAFDFWQDSVDGEELRGRFQPRIEEEDLRDVPVAVRRPINFDGAIPNDGLLHVIDNAASDLSKAMSGYKKAVSKMKHVCRLLRGRDNRPKLLERCFDSIAGRAHHRDIYKFKGNVHAKRWGTIAFSLPELLAIEPAVRMHWDLGKFRGKDVPDDAVDDADSDDGQQWKTNVDKADDAIKDPAFWGYLRMLDAIASMIRRLHHFAEWCPCHGELVRDLDGMEDAALARKLRTMWERCSLRGCRAPALANGVHE